MPATTSPNSTRRRLALLITLAFVLGLLTTITLCWSAAVLFPPSEIHEVRQVDDWALIGDRWFHATIDQYRCGGSLLSWSCCHYNARWSQAGSIQFGPPRLSNPGDLSSVPPPGTALWLMPWLDESSPSRTINLRERRITTYGWPLPAIAHLRDFIDAASSKMTMSTEWSWPPPSCLRLPAANVFGSTEFPLRPLWVGLTVNSLLAASVWFGLFLAIPTTRAALRRRRGLCSRCAYDLRGTPSSAPCPECGSGP